MGCCGEREKGVVPQTARWDYITLSDFKSTSFWTPLAYAWLWQMAFVAVAVYAVDTFTAVNLIAFNQWSSSIEPAIPFQYSKWIFAICIFISYALCILAWMKALRIIKRGGVASSYMDPLAASLQSMRPKGWKRFLVLSELTKSKKGTDYIAFFVYFAYQTTVRVILAEGPRQVVNALTLYPVVTNLVLHNDPGYQSESGWDTFWHNFHLLGEENIQQLLILSGMLFTLVIWVFSVLCLILSAILYLLFLWHYIPQRDGSLKMYCRRKIDRRLEKIVEHKYKAAIDEENKKREKEERKAELKRQKTGELPPPLPPKIARKPTLPQFQDDDKTGMRVQRSDTASTVSTLPPYETQPASRRPFHRQPTLDDLHSSHATYDSDAPLLANAGFAGGPAGSSLRTASPAPTYFSRADSNTGFASSTGPPSDRATPRPPHMGMGVPRSAADTTIFRNGSAPPLHSNPGHGGGHRGVPRSNTGLSYDHPPARSGASSLPPHNGYGRPLPPRFQGNMQHPDGFGPGSGGPRPPYAAGSGPGPPRSQRPYAGYSESDRRNGSSDSYEMTSQLPPAGYAESDRRNGSMDSYEMMLQHPSSSATTSSSRLAPAAPDFGNLQNAPRAPHPFPGAPSAHLRSATAPPQDSRGNSSYDGILDHYMPASRSPVPSDAWPLPQPPPPPPMFLEPPRRAHTAGPFNGREREGWGNRF